MKTLLTSLGAIIVGLLFLGSPAYAQSSLCDGLTGPAKGLCSAAEELGCEGGTGDHPACEHIASTYQRVVGGELPWAPCPCFSASQLSFRPFDSCYDKTVTGNDGRILYQAILTNSPYPLFASVNPNEDHADVGIYNPYHGCTYAKEGILVTQVPGSAGMTDLEALSCYALIINDAADKQLTCSGVIPQPQPK
jgi:hypothetical protein